MYVEARADVAQTLVAACLKATLKVVEEETRLEVECPPPAPEPVADLGEDAPDGSKEPNGTGSAKPSSKCIRCMSSVSVFSCVFVGGCEVLNSIPC